MIPLDTSRKFRGGVCAPVIDEEHISCVILICQVRKNRAKRAFDTERFVVRGNDDRLGRTFSDRRGWIGVETQCLALGTQIAAPGPYPHVGEC
jgi:hypothetical protein